MIFISLKHQKHYYFFDSQKNTINGLFHFDFAILSCNKDIVTIRYWLGLTDIATTMICDHLVPNKLAHAAAILDSYDHEKVDAELMQIRSLYSEPELTRRTLTWISINCLYGYIADIEDFRRLKCKRGKNSY
jgi:hypothetical protein